MSMKIEKVTSFHYSLIDVTTARIIIINYGFLVFHLYQPCKIEDFLYHGLKRQIIYCINISIWPPNDFVTVLSMFFTAERNILL